MKTPSKDIWNVIEVLKELGGFGTARQVINRLINQRNIPKKDQGNASRGIHSAVNILTRLGYIDPTKYGVWALTQIGQTRNLEAKEIIDLLLNHPKIKSGYCVMNIRKFPLELKERLKQVGSDLGMTLQKAAPLALSKGIHILENPEIAESLSKPSFDSYIKGQEGKKSKLIVFNNASVGNSIIIPFHSRKMEPHVSLNKIF